MDGTWHPVTVSTRSPDLRVLSPHYYVAPTDAVQAQMPATMKALLQKGENVSGIQTAAHAWLFPESKIVQTRVLAANFNWPDNGPKTPAGARLQIFAQLIDETMGTPVGSWVEEKTWPPDATKQKAVHWRREVYLYPGSYLLKVMSAPKKVGDGEMIDRCFYCLCTPLSLCSAASV